MEWTLVFVIKSLFVRFIIKSEAKNKSWSLEGTFRGGAALFGRRLGVTIQGRHRVLCVNKLEYSFAKLQLGSRSNQLWKLNYRLIFKVGQQIFGYRKLFNPSFGVLAGRRMLIWVNLLVFCTYQLERKKYWPRKRKKSKYYLPERERKHR